MPRKRSEGVTTYPRYKAKAYRMGTAVSGGETQLARDYAEALTAARAAGYGIYKIAWEEIKPVLMRLEVPSALHGLYKAYANELIHKVQVKKLATVDDIVDKWAAFGLDVGVLRQVAETVVQVMVKESPKAAKKAA